MENAVIEKKNGWGGARRAGGIRPYATKKAQTEILRTQMTNMLKPRAEELFIALMDAACGLRLADGKNGRRIYSKAPDIQAAKLLIEHTMGKPKETLQHQGTLSIMNIIRSLEGSDTPNSED